MIVHRGYKFGIYPTPEQEQFFLRVAGSCRFVWNLALDQRRQFSRRGRNIGFTAQQAELRYLKAEADFLKEVPHHCLMMALRNLETTFSRFFQEKGGHPFFKGRNSRRSFTFPDPKQFSFDIEAGTASFPKIGKSGLPPIRVRYHRKIEGEILSATIGRDGPFWHVSFVTAREVERPAAPAGEPVGQDMGCHQPIAQSDGSFPIQRPVRVLTQIVALHPSFRAGVIHADTRDPNASGTRHTGSARCRHGWKILQNTNYGLRKYVKVWIMQTTQLIAT